MLKKVTEFRKRANRLVDLIPYNGYMLETLRKMHESQGYVDIDMLAHETLPKIGWIAMHFNDNNVGTAVAAGFLRMVEGGFAQIDTLVSNAEYSSEMRHLAISTVVDKLIEEAKKLNLHGILATSKDESTIKRAVSIGFHVISEQQLIALPLKETVRHV